MIVSWQHRGLKEFFLTGNKKGITPHHAVKLKIILQRLNAAIQPKDMNTPGMGFYELAGNLKGFFSVSVNGNWRIIFKFEGQDAFLVDYTDYH